IAGAPVAVEVLRGGAFSTVTTVATRADGSWWAALPVAANTTVRALYAGGGGHGVAVSPTLPVAVAPARALAPLPAGVRRNGLVHTRPPHRAHAPPDPAGLVSGSLPPGRAPVLGRSPVDRAHRRSHRRSRPLPALGDERLGDRVARARRHRRLGAGHRLRARR